ncbi:monocarboxylate permease-like protein [Bisporella sp. PMI_857]|nr:monocarboxylate permease-like protein [Bisporella sp. PMI_857]
MSEKVDEREVSVAKEPDTNTFPDGGLEAWLVVVGGFCTIFASFGWINCIGIFQDYYQMHQLRNYSPSTIAWIPSTESFMMFFWAPVVGKVTDDFGPRIPILIGSFLHIFGLMMTSISKEYYQIFLSQSICSAIGCSFLFYPSMTAAASWFLRHRALAIGLMVAGSSIGGIILPIMVNRLVNEIGFGWTMRGIAFMLLGILVLGNLTVKSRLPPTRRPFKLKDFLVPYTEPAFLLLTIGSFFIFFGGFLPFNFVIVQARAEGMSANLAGYLVPIINAASTFGRIIPAHFGDMYGVFNIFIITTALCGILNLAVWLPVHSNAGIIVFAVLYGFTSGCTFSIIPAMVARMTTDIRTLGVRTGSLYVVSACGALVGSPIAGAISNSQDGGFSGLIVFCGVTLLAGTLFTVFSGCKQVGLKLMAKV